MILLIAGIVLFVGAHAVHLVAPGWRQARIASMGLDRWKGLVSGLSLLGLVLIAWGYGASRMTPVFIWNPPLWSRHLALLFTLAAFILIAAAYVPANHLKQKLGHPMFAGVKLWAFAHLLANGRLSDIVLFGVFLVWAIAGFAISRRRDRKGGVGYPAGTPRGTVLTIVAGSIAWAIFAFSLHRMLIGVAPI